MGARPTAAARPLTGGSRSAILCRMEIDEHLHKLSKELLTKARRLRDLIEEGPDGGDKQRMEDLGRQIESNSEMLLAQHIKPVLIVRKGPRLQA